MSIYNKIKLWHNDRNYLKLGIFLLIIIVILELTVFNYKFYKNIGNEPIDANFTSHGQINNLGDNTYRLLSGERGFEIRNINTHLKNIYLDIEIVGDKEIVTNKQLVVAIKATDDGNAQYVTLPEKTVVYSQPQTKYINLNLNGESEKLDILVKGANNKIIRVNEIILNPNVPFNFDIFRVLILFAIVALIYIIRPKSHFYSYIFNEKSTKQKLVVFTTVIINICVILVLGILNPNTKITKNNQQYQYHLLAEALMDGHFYLNEEPPEALVNMDNPYDRYERDRVLKEADETYRWDVAYYEGKYYVYFGIVPELLFFLPTRLLGIMIINKAPVMIMLMLSVIFGYLLMRELTRRWFKDTSFLIYMLMSVLFVNSIGIYLGIRVPDLYMIPISHALAFSLMGLYLWLRALPDNEGEKLDGVNLFLGSLSMALVAGCRPQVVLASFLAIPMFWKYVFKERQLFSVKSIGKTIAFVSPYVVVAVFLMFYNYSRFGNPFDFGASYNLTTMDMVSEKFSIGKIPLGLFTYYIQPPYITGIFPYIQKVDIYRNFMGNFVMEQLYGGMIPCNIILISLFFVRKVKDSLKAKKLFIPWIMLVAFGIIITVADFNTGGLIHRYMIDFMWLIFGACVITIFALYEKYSNTALHNMVHLFIFVGFIWSMAYNFMVLFNPGTASYEDNIPELYSYFRHMIEFWT